MFGIEHRRPETGSPRIGQVTSRVLLAEPARAGADLVVTAAHGCPRSRPPPRVAARPQEPRLLADRRRDARARHRREHGDLQPARSAAAAAAAGEESLRAGPAERPGAEHGLLPELERRGRAVLAPDVRRLPRSRRGGVERRARAVPDRVRRGRPRRDGAGGGLDRFRHLLRGARGRRRRRPGAHPGGRPHARRAPGGRDQPGLLAAPLRRRRRRDRASDQRQRRAADGRGCFGARLSRRADRALRRRVRSADDEGADDADLERPRRSPGDVARGDGAAQAGRVARAGRGGDGRRVPAGARGRGARDGRPPAEVPRRLRREEARVSARRTGPARAAEAAADAAPRADGHGRARGADRLRQRREPAARPRVLPPEGDRRAARDRRGSASPRPPAARREPHAVVPRRAGRPAARGRHHRHPAPRAAFRRRGTDALLRTGPARGAVRARAVRRNRAAGRPRAGAAGDAPEPRDGPQGGRSRGGRVRAAALPQGTRDRAGRALGAAAGRGRAVHPQPRQPAHTRPRLPQPGPADVQLHAGTQRLHGAGDASSCSTVCESESSRCPACARRLWRRTR